MSVARLQALYTETLSRLEEVTSQPGPNVTVSGPNGSITVDKIGYMKSLMEQLKELAKMPGVVTDLTPTFEIFG